jgi:tetratricopeptide (TPR) repeat protein
LSTSYFSRFSRERFLRAILCAALVLSIACVALAEPFVPKNDAQVLERLPYTPGDPEGTELRAQHDKLSRNPGDVALAVNIAREYIRAGREQGDPRYFGYAQAALEPWWSVDNAPAEILVLRAGIKQASHDFSGALDDLNQALQEDPDNLNAALTRAIILQVRGRYQEAQQDCARLLEAAQRAPSLQLTAVTCVASVASFDGEATRGIEVLQQVLKTSGAGAEDRQWALTTLADIATRLGRAQAAERYFQAALALGEHTWLLGAYADFLLQRHRPQEVIGLLRDDTDVDSLLLLLALAEQEVDAPRLDEHVEMLRERFEASRLRNDQRHLREEARFTLRILNKPRKALKLAHANWQTQHEPEDARILLQAALAAGKPQAARSVLEFLKEVGLEDVRLERLRRQLNATPGA